MMMLEPVPKVSLLATIHALGWRHAVLLDILYLLRKVSLLATIHVLKITHVVRLEPIRKVSMLATLHVLEKTHANMLETSDWDVRGLRRANRSRWRGDVSLLAITHVGVTGPVQDWETLVPPDILLPNTLKENASLLVTTHVAVKNLVTNWENIGLDPLRLESSKRMPLPRVMEPIPVILVIVQLPDNR